MGKTNPELVKIRDAINKQFGFNVSRIASEVDNWMTERISTGSVSLDIILGGGIPVGRMIHVSGMESSSKSMMAYLTGSKFQERRKKKILWEKYCTPGKPIYRELLLPVGSKEGDPLKVALIQFETHSYANDWAQKIGLNIDELIFVQPASLEEGLDVAIKLQEMGVELIIVDSYAAAKPGLILETESQDKYQLGIKQIKLDDFHGRWQALNNKADREGRIPTTLFAINQRREKIGFNLGDPTYAPGGKSKDFTAAIDLILRQGDNLTIGSGTNKFTIGRIVHARTKKNKTYAPAKTTSWDLYFDEGGPVPAGKIDNAKSIVLEAVAFEIINKKGSWFAYKGKNLAQGAEATIELIRKDNKLFEEIREKLMEVAFEEERKEEEELKKLALEKKVAAPKAKKKTLTRRSSKK